MTVPEARTILRHFVATNFMNQKSEYLQLLKSLLNQLKTESQKERLIRHFEKEYYTL